MTTLSVIQKEEYEKISVRIPKRFRVLLKDLGGGIESRGLNEILHKNEKNILKAIAEKERESEKESLKKRKKAC